MPVDQKSQSLQRAKNGFRKDHPNLPTNGWDARDSELWSAIRNLPSYGLIHRGDVMISRDHVIELLHERAEKRFEDEWKQKCGK